MNSLHAIPKPAVHENNHTRTAGPAVDKFIGFYVAGDAVSGAATITVMLNT